MIENSPKQQAVELIKSATSILVATHKNPDGDALGSIIALKLALEKLDKKVEIVCPERPGELFGFLPRVDKILTKVPESKELVISVSTKTAEVDKIGYKKDGDKVNIVVTAKAGNFKVEDVKVEPPKAKFDLVIVVDTPNIERLGSLAQPADVFYETPVVNIDHHPSNERFGRVNWVELVATSTTEILVSLFEALSRDVKLFDEDVATALLTGLIYDTSSFQNINTTPKSLTVAAQLVAAGGRQQEIIKHLYKTKALSTLKLWGIILSQVKEDGSHKFLWSSISHEDLVRVGADESALSGVVDELLKSATDVDFVLLLSEREGQIHGSLRAIARGVNVAEIAEGFGGGGHESAAAFRYDGTLKENEHKVLDKIRQMRSKSPASPAATQGGPASPAGEKTETNSAHVEKRAEESQEDKKSDEKTQAAKVGPQISPEIATEAKPEVEEETALAVEPEGDAKPAFSSPVFDSPITSSNGPLDITAELTQEKKGESESAPVENKTDEKEEREKTKW